MKLFYSDHYVLPLPAGHFCPMEKYGLLHTRIAESGLVPPAVLCEPPVATDQEILRAHTPEYLRRLCEGSFSAEELRRLGLPWSPHLVERARRASGGTLAAGRAALAEGVAMNLAGGSHHAFADAPEGFCVLNDTVIAARALQAEGRVQRVLVIDCDAHQGNGTASITRHDPSIFTLSIHNAQIFPFPKDPSDLDIDLLDDFGDADYLAALETGLLRALDRSAADLAIYLAGSDPFVDDRLGRLALTKQGLLERDDLVLAHCESAGLPVAITLAGGYARDVRDTVDVHFGTFAVALRRWQHAFGERGA